MGTVVGTWRLKLILILVIFSTAVYTANAIFGDLGGNVTEEGYIDYTPEKTNVTYNATDLSTDQGTSFTDVLFGIGDFLTFGSITNTWVRLFFNGVMGIVLITIGYVVFTFIKEFIPFV